MRTYKELFELISKHIAETSYGAEPRELYEPINYMMSLGGKRLRPVTTLMACNMFDEEIEKAIPAALAIEMFHNFTLVHDDIMDNAPLRRGKETIYKKWNMPIAILSGDLMMIKATESLCKTETSDIIKLLKKFNDIATKVCEGQQIDMNFESRNDVSHNEYINMISLKTAVLLGGALQIGALIGGANEEDAGHLYEFGKNTGIAFQVQDDILDSFGDAGKTGKKTGGDIAADKKTLLLIELLAAAHKDDKKLLQELMNEIDDDKKITGILQLYHKYKVKEFAEAEKEKYLQLAYRHFNKVNVNADRKSILKQTAEELMSRTS